MKKNLKKNKILITLVLLVFTVGMLNNYFIYNSENVNSSDSITDEYVSIYLGDEQGNYELSNQEVFEYENYTFNAELSYCKNGSSITWNDTVDQVYINATKSDNCYVYFDIIPS